MKLHPNCIFPKRIHSTTEPPVKGRRAVISRYSIPQPWMWMSSRQKQITRCNELLRNNENPWRIEGSSGVTQRRLPCVYTCASTWGVSQWDFARWRGDTDAHAHTYAVPRISPNTCMESPWLTLSYVTSHNESVIIALVINVSVKETLIFYTDF